MAFPGILAAVMAAAEVAMAEQPVAMAAYRAAVAAVRVQAQGLAPAE